MNKNSKSMGGPGTMTTSEGKTSIRSTMKPVFGRGKGRKSASRLKGRPTTGR